VVDANSPDPEGEMAAVRNVLGEIDALGVPELLVFNKADLDPVNAKRLVEQHEGSLAISALQGDGTHDFMQTLADRLRALAKVVELLVPYDRGDIIAAVHREGEVVSTAHEPDGIRIRARLATASAGRLDEFVVHGV
jgi:GTP-binding protein HflX